MAFFLFFLVNAALFIRPSEILPGWQGVEVYFYVIVACLVASLGDILVYFTDQPLERKPITLCVLGIFVAILIPPLLAGDLDDAWRCGFTFAKVVAYFLLFVSLVNTPARLLAVQRWLLAFTSVTAALAILCYLEILDIPALRPLADNSVGGRGVRLKGTGILNDPNEFCTAMAMMIPLSVHFLLNDKNPLLKFFWAVSTALFFVAMYYTFSRGGFLALIAGMVVGFAARYGWRRAALFASVGVPLLLVVFGGRATQLNLDSSNTSMSRVHLWSDWLDEFRGNLLFGKGTSIGVEALERQDGIPFKHLAHNSFLQGFADLGIGGGCLFLGAFVIAIWSISRLGHKMVLMLDPQMRQARPYVLAAVVTYCVGMATLSICYVLPTFLVLAMASAYERTALRSCLRSPPPLRFDIPLLGRFVVWGVMCLAAIYLFVRVFINR
jgi:hypothetical protein